MRWTKALLTSFIVVFLGCELSDGVFENPLDREVASENGITPPALVFYPDVVITTAQVFGRKPPTLVTRDMIDGMRAGSVIVDMAAETGGNVEGSVPGETVVINGVTVIGNGNWANVSAHDASHMYSSNLFNLVDEFWDPETNAVILNFEDDILQGCIVTHQGMIVNETIKRLDR